MNYTENQQRLLRLIQGRHRRFLLSALKGTYHRRYYTHPLFKDLLGGKRWLEVEDMILAGNVDDAIEYCVKHVGTRWPKLEEKLLLDDGDEYYYFINALTYARRVIRGRWPELEVILLQTPDNGRKAFQYLEDVFSKGERWFELEKYLVTDVRKLRDPDDPAHFTIYDGEFYQQTYKKRTGVELKLCI